MNTKHSICIVLGLLALVSISTAARGQTQTSGQQATPSRPPAATLPAKIAAVTSGTGAVTSGKSSATVVGKPTWLASVETSTFPGAMLLNDQPPFFAAVNVDHPSLSYEEGETLTVKFTAEREANLYLLYHQADGSSSLLFPNEAHRDNHMMAGKTVTVPADDQEFRFRVSPPYGTEVLQVIATLKPTPELDHLVQKLGRAAPVTKEQLVALNERLQKERKSWTEHRVSIKTSARSQPVARRPARVGLFVGVNKFQWSENKEDEKGQGKNARFRLGAELMAKAMLERGKLDPQRAKLLTDENATRANIEAAITGWLPSVTQPGDTVFIFYASHGGLVRNLDGTKPDGKDGVLTTYDNNFESQRMSNDQWDAAAREHFIADATLARWLQQLPGRQIAVIISSCHAGSMIDARLLARFAAQETTRVKGISGMNVSVVASCMPDESTISDPDKPVWLASGLTEAMNRLPGPVTLRQAYEYYRTEHQVRSRQSGQAGVHEPVMTDTALLPIVLAP